MRPAAALWRNLVGLEPAHRFQYPQMGSIWFFEDQMDKRGVHCAVVMDLLGHDLPMQMIVPALLSVVAALNRYIGDMSDLPQVVGPLRNSSDRRCDRSPILVPVGGLVFGVLRSPVASPWRTP